MKKQNYCIDCNKPISSHGAKRCKSCANKGKNNSMFRVRLCGEKNGMLGKKHSEETKCKMRKNHWDCSGEKGSFYGKTHTNEAKQKIGKASKKNNYKNGTGFVIRKQFLESIDYTCSRCGFRERLEDVKAGKKCRINAHHIIPKEVDPRKLNDFSNLCGLCASCHRKYHRRNAGNIGIESLVKFINIE